MNKDTMNQVYLDGQAACGITIGDIVRIKRAAVKGEGGWRAPWNIAMCGLVGRCGVVLGIQAEYGIRLQIINADVGVWAFPYFVLEKITSSAEMADAFNVPRYESVMVSFSPYDKVLVRDSDTEVWWCALFSHYDDRSEFRHVCVSAGGYRQCIPYEGNEHLVGTRE